MPHITPLQVLGKTTERHSPAFRASVDAGNFIMTEFRQAPSLVACLELAETNLQGALDLDAKTNDGSGNRFRDAVRWAHLLRRESFHPIYASSVLAMWAVIEASIEDVFAALLETRVETARLAVGLLKPGKFHIDKWPWTSEIRVEIAKQVQTKAKKALNDDHSAFRRVQQMYGWLGVHIDLKAEVVCVFDEAVQVRNVLVHRNGQISATDVAQAPHLGKYQGSVIRIDSVAYLRYGIALIAFHAAMVEAVSRFEVSAAV